MKFRINIIENQQSHKIVFDLKHEPINHRQNSLIGPALVLTVTDMSDA